MLTIILETDILIETNGLGSIPVVTDGMQILRKVEDGKHFHKKMKKGKDKDKDMRSQKPQNRLAEEEDESNEAEDSEDSEPVVQFKQVKSRTVTRARQIIPLPSRAQSSTQDLRPSKRKRQDDHEDYNSNVVRQPSYIPSQIHRRRDKHVTSPIHTPPLGAARASQSHRPVVASHDSAPSSHAHFRPSTLRTSQPTRLLPSHHINEVSTSRLPSHRQLTPVLEDYYPVTAQHQHSIIQNHATPQYHPSSHHGQPPVHFRQSLHPTHHQPSHSNPHVRRSHVAPVHSQSRYYSGGRRGNEGYDYHDDGYNAEGVDYGDEYF